MGVLMKPASSRARRMAATRPSIMSEGAMMSMPAFVRETEVRARSSRFNGNGKTGIAVYQYGDGIEITYNPGNGNFTIEPTLQIPNQPNYLCAGDFNRDGYSDFAVLDGNEVDIYLNLHNDTYSGPVTYKLGSNPVYILCHDVNNDGKIDLATANNGSNDVSVLLGKGDGRFDNAKEYPAGSKPNAVAFGGFNRDGKIDLAVGGNNVDR